MKGKKNNPDWTVILFTVVLITLLLGEGPSSQPDELMLLLNGLIHRIR